MNTTLQDYATPLATGPTCHKCGAPATAGNAPNSVRRKICVGCTSLATLNVPPTVERRLRAPQALLESPAWALAAAHTGDDTLWLHQSTALEHLFDGENTVVATSTASGKTLIFQAYVLHQIATDPEARAIVLYPTKALANDQEGRWKEACKTMGLPPSTIGKIDGSVGPMYRDKILSDSQVIIMTPDVCHAWMTRRSTAPVIQQFLAGLMTIVIDEAHTYESVFGSNSAYLFRRLASAAADAGATTGPLYIAATATIEAPAAHLRKLTGQAFTVIEETDNGAPKHPRTVLHVPTGPTINERQMAMANLIVSIIDADPDAQVIAFCDSRQGVERIVQIIDRPQSVMPYRSGYRPDERRDIENRLRENKIRAVVATSALELGIDMPDLSYGIQIDLPPSRKQFHQRLGRIGRSKPGTFIVLAVPDRFSIHGDTLQGYFDKPVEPSQLYLNNEFISFTQALCLKAELQARRQSTLLAPDHCEWPTNFQASLNYANGYPPEHLAPMARASSDKSPHIVHSIRSTGEDHLSILETPPGDNPRAKTQEIGDISVSLAMQEAYPGAIYRHRGQPYRIEAWRRRANGDPYITATRIRDTSERTRPIIRQIIEINPDQEHIIADRYDSADLGCIAEMMAIVTESVEGYLTINQNRGRPPEQPLFYRDTVTRDSGKSRKQRQFPTTGMLLRINQPWFTGSKPENVQARNEIAQALRRQLSYERSIAIQDIRASAGNIVIGTPKGHHLAEDAIVVYDGIFGGLGLIDHLYMHLEDYAVALTESNAELEESQILLQPANAHRFKDWIDVSSTEGTGELPDPDVQNWWRVLPPDAPAFIREPDTRIPVRVRVISHVWQDQVMYLLDTPEGEFLAPEQDVKNNTTNPDWHLWQPSSGRYTTFDQD